MTQNNQTNTVMREIDLSEMSLVCGAGPSREFFKDVAYAAGFAVRNGGSSVAFVIGYAIASSNNG